MSKSLLSKALIFATGAAIGSIVTWKFVKNKYEKLANEEIEAVREVYRKEIPKNPRKEKSKETIEVDKSTLNETITKAMDVCEKQGYVQYSNVEKNRKKEDDTMSEGPYVITPEEYSNCDYYTESLTYWADDVLTDDSDNIIEDVDDLVGEDSLTHFGEYEDDTVFVRDDERGIDYEICLDVRKFHDVCPDE